MFTRNAESAPKDGRGWLIFLPIAAMVAIPLSAVAHDIRVTLVAGFCVLAVQAVVARSKGLSPIVQVALWVGALAFAASACFLGPHLHSG